MLCVALFCDIMMLVFENNGFVYAWRVFLTSHTSLVFVYVIMYYIYTRRHLRPIICIVIVIM